MQERCKHTHTHTEHRTQRTQRTKTKTLFNCNVKHIIHKMYEIKTYKKMINPKIHAFEARVGCWYVDFICFVGR